MTAEQAISWLTLKPKDLPVFVLIATDPLALKAIDTWLDEAVKADIPDAKVLGAQRVLGEFERWPVKKRPE